jgi:23S rRNA (adenine2503-C2)-methyltransferase
MLAHARSVADRGPASLQSRPAMTIDLLATPAEDLHAAAAAHFGDAKGAGLAAAIHRAAVCSGQFAPERHGAGPRTAAAWRALAALPLPAIVAQHRELGDHGAVAKHLLALADGNTVESVLLPMGRGRTTVCVSTQVGCARACTFCETGRLGLLRNLSAGEIVGQVTVHARERRPDAIVFMGMGEPLDNLPALLPALAVLADRRGLAYAQERLTVCTVGHVPGLHALQQLGWKRMGLALSLHAADDARRAQLLPRSVRYPLREIQAALRAYRQRANLALGLHWCLLPGINDGDDDVRQLAAFAAPLGRCVVHVIPYNPGTAPIARAPSDAEVAAFVARLRAAGLAVRRRVTKGRSLMAACGQLGGGSPGAVSAS